MGLASVFGFGTQSDTVDELPSIFPVNFKDQEFIKIDVTNIYSKILTDVVERTHGLTDEQKEMMWDNCLQSENSEGLVTMLVTAMYDKSDLFIVYDKSLKLIRRAKDEEKRQIEADYKAKGESSIGIFVSFKRYDRTDIVRFYSGLEYCTVAALYKKLNLSKAVQIKINDLRSGVALSDSVTAKTQAREIATALSKGLDIYMDGKDMVETAIPDLAATKESLIMLDQKRCFYLGMPQSYVTGELPGGLGDSGEGDARAVERGLKNYFVSIMKPVCDAVFKINTSFKSQDFRQLGSALEALKIFTLTAGGEDGTAPRPFLSHDEQVDIIRKLLGLDETQEKKAK